MKAKGKFEKYINFSIFSNIAIFNSLADCKCGKDGKSKDKNKKGNKGCCDSGKGEKTTINYQGQQSADEQEKKQREEQERKAKEEADRLAKEKQDLLQKIAKYKEKYNNLKVKVDELNDEDPTNPINIDKFITLDEINNLEIKNITAIDERFSNLEKEITKKQKEIEGKLKVEKDTLNKEFNDINNDVTIINTQNVYNIIVPTDIVKIDEIISCKLNKINDLKAKLENFKNTKDQKITEIRTKLKEDLSKVNDTDEKKTNLSKFKGLGIPTNDDIDKCSINDFSNMKTKIEFFQNLASGDIEVIKKFFNNEIEKYKDLVDIFKNIDRNIENQYKNLITALDLVSIKSISNFYNSISVFQKKINDSINNYNRENTDFINNIKVKVAELHYEYKILKFDYKFEVLELNKLDINSKKVDYDNIETNKKNIETKFNTKTENINNELKKLILLIYDTYKVLYVKDDKDTKGEEEYNKKIKDINDIDVKIYDKLKEFKERITNLDKEYKDLISTKI